MNNSSFSVDSERFPRFARKSFIPSRHSAITAGLNDCEKEEKSDSCPSTLKTEKAPSSYR